MDSHSEKAMQERMRRERVTSAVNDLKELLISTSQLRVDQAAEMKKAELCESTVSYLHRVQREARLIRNQEIEAGRFNAGLAQARNEVKNILTVTPSVDSELNQRLLAHLSHPVIDQVDEIQMKTTSLATLTRFSDENSADKSSKATITSSSDEEIDIEN